MTVEGHVKFRCKTCLTSKLKNYFCLNRKKITDKKKLLFWIFISVFGTFSLIFGVRVNTSPSLPQTIFILKNRPNKFNYDDYIVFRVNGFTKKFVKIIKGLPGDTVTIKENYLYINGENCGYIKSQSDSGKKYHPIQEGTIPDGYLYAYASHPDSFDSRYREFGLVNENAVEEVVCPVF
ncbi:conjugal transfer pilin processing protease TraF [Candidatus Rubidus massiliensis]|nr:conjugal transfer pilin processing protease TraF [Candidatus Rubidus massiliensis]